MRALRPRVVMYFGQGHTAGKLQSQDWNPSSLIDLMWPSALSNQAYVSENAVCVTCAVSLSGGELVLLNPEWDCLRLLLLSIANMDSEKQINV